MLNTNASLFWIIMDVYMITEKYIIQVILLLFSIVVICAIRCNKKLPLNSTTNFGLEDFEVCKPLHFFNENVTKKVWKSSYTDLLAYGSNLKVPPYSVGMEFRNSLPVFGQEEDLGRPYIIAELRIPDAIMVRLVLTKF